MITQFPMKHAYIPLRIYQARVSRALSQDELARAVNITKQAISQYETGASKPSEEVIRNIAGLLKFPITFFTKLPNIISTAQGASFFRSYKTASVKDKAAWTQKVQLFDEVVMSKLREFVEFPAFNMPYISIQDSYTIDDCERIAMEVRNYWGLGTGPINNLVDVLQENGIVIANMISNEKKIDAFSTIFNTIPYIYISEDTISSVRWRFSLAHELGHIIMHSGLYEDNSISSIIHDNLEREADFFASAFLIPQETFFKDVSVLSLDHFLYLKKKWKVSIGAMIMKCKNFEIISPTQYETLYKKLAVRQWRISEPLDDICKLEKPYLLKQAFELLIENNIISTDGIETDFGLFPDELARWSFTPNDVFFPEENKKGNMKLIPKLVPRD